VVTNQTFENRLEKAEQRRNAKHLRTFQTPAERNFWYNVRAHRLAGYKFRRQHPIGPYIVDFVCLSARLIVELDGGQHAGQQEYDEKRDAFLKERCFRVLRIWNNEMLKNRDVVLELVLQALRSGDAPSP